MPDRDRCANCRHFYRGYLLQGLRVPTSCNRHFHTVSHDDPACPEHETREDDD